MDVDTILNTIKEYGNLYYGVVFAWTFLEGETFVIFSGVAARQGIIDIWVLTSVAWLGGFCGDQIYFFIGRTWGAKLLVKFPKFKPGIQKALSILEKHSVKFILTFRFAYGIRNVSPFAIGMSSISWRRFAILNFIAAGIWAAAFAGGGYLAGVAFQSALGEALQDIGLLLLAVALCLVLWLYTRSREKN
ncbi:membrane-associated protein [Azospirillaceae bacterium]